MGGEEKGEIPTWGMVIVRRGAVEGGRLQLTVQQKVANLDKAGEIDGGTGETRGRWRDAPNGKRLAQAHVQTAHAAKPAISFRFTVLFGIIVRSTCVRRYPSTSLLFHLLSSEQREFLLSRVACAAVLPGRHTKDSAPTFYLLSFSMSASLAPECNEVKE